jgi:hypothetical protein
MGFVDRLLPVRPVRMSSISGGGPTGVIDQERVNE